MKKFVSFIICVVIVLMLPHFDVLAMEYEPTENNFIASGYCGAEADGKNLSWSIDKNGVLTISGTGAMADYPYKGAPWYVYKDRFSSLVIEEGITDIGAYAFKDCSNITGSLILPEGLVTIGNFAFGGCFGLTGNLAFPEGILEIRYGAFSRCSGFTGDLVIPESILVIEGETFDSCSGFDGSLVLPKNLRSIDTGAFYGCSGFTGKLVIPENVTRINAGVFENCTGFTSLELGENVKYFGTNAFYNCTGFKGEFVIPAKVSTIGAGAFIKCGFSEYYFPGDAPTAFNAEASKPSFDENEDTIHYPVNNSTWVITDGKWNGYNAVLWKNTITYGDVNNDGKINVLDANLIRRYSAKLVEFTDEQFSAADVDGNGKVNVLDANLVRRYAAKLIDKFPAEK